ncbi:MAG: sugar phosphate nucleotidyltransferase [Terrimicrobiaceae bacterium]|nr:sugar phosphate nucleotidyltransferase [Terrimicrobiaceae bacterium]
MNPPPAFVMGAGLGTRLRPLTDDRPKPLVPVFGRPLITLAFDHLRSAGVERFVVNTHHRAAAYREFLGGDGSHTVYRGCPVNFRHEPVLLDTGGGLSNIRDLTGSGDLVIYNGDVLADFPLEPLIDQHRVERNLATLAVRSVGGPLHIQCADRRVVDIRGALGSTGAESFLFTGVSIVSREFLERLPGPAVFSIISIYLDLLREGGRIGAHHADTGLWLDLGTPEAILDAHRELATRGLAFAGADWPQLPETGQAGPGEIRGVCGIGEGVEIALGGVVEDSILWERARVAPGVRLKRCIVRAGVEVLESGENRIF